MTSREFRYHRRKKQERHSLNWDINIKQDANSRICEDEGCSHMAVVRCVLDYLDEPTGEWKEEVEWLCYEHAKEAGYCTGCGVFMAGTGMEYRNHGYCDNCWDEIKANEWEDEDLSEDSIYY